jgi:hypothetical protein
MEPFAAGATCADRICPTNVVGVYHAGFARLSRDMSENDPDKLKGPGGLTLRQIHEQVRNSVARDEEAAKIRNADAQTPTRWQRALSFLSRYMRDRKRG